MKILNISTRITGGAGRAALLFNENLNNHGFESMLLVKYGTIGKLPDTLVSVYPYFLYVLEEFTGKFKRWIGINSGLNQKQYHVFDMDAAPKVPSLYALTNKIAFNPDVIVLHWIDLFLSTDTITQLSKKYPKAIIVWMFMDMAPMTGGCHYSLGCKGYVHLCGKCPAIESQNELDDSRSVMLAKKKLLDSVNIVPIICSKWTYMQAMESYLFGAKRLYKILLPVNPDIYKPGSKLIARNLLGLPADKKIIFFGATYLSDTRKGVKYIIKALELYKAYLEKNEIPTDDFVLAIVGNCTSDLLATLPFQSYELGILQADNKLPLAYQSADLFLCSSTDDSGPLMINESIMSGTPVVSFRMGVALDLVINNYTGYIANVGDSLDLFNGIKCILDLDASQYETMSKQCRSLGLKMCHPQVQVTDFINLVRVEAKF